VFLDQSGVEAIVGSAAAEKQPAYDTGAVRVGLDAASWSAALFVDNVWDERGVTFISNRWAKQRVSLIHPRTVGLQLHYRFGK
jgi:hypothetical protein